MNAQTSKRGFTIIEVVLVLAIAALIFLMIFIALPALQRGQRDTARKQDVGKVVSAVNSYRSNNRGAIDTLDSTRLDKYVNGELGQVQTVTVDAPADPAVDAIDVAVGKKCGADGALAAGTPRQAAVRTTLENGVIYCEAA